MASTCESAILPNIEKVVLNSGRFAARMGRYVPCIADPATNYNWVSIHQPQSGQPVLNIGICLPTQCEQQQTTMMIDKLLIDVELPYRVLGIDSQVDQFDIPYSATFYITIAILMSLTLLTIIASLIKYSQIRHQKRVNYFSIQSSSQIFTYKQNRLNVFNGLKAYSMLWVIFGHQYFFNLNVSSNVFTFSDTLLSPYFLFVQAGMLAVEVFLFVGGFFVGYAIFKQKQYSLMKVPLAVVNRILRFWPSYLIAVFIFYSVLLHLGSGPYWSSLQAQTQLCGHWWRSLLFIDNLVQNGKYICMSWSWYLHIDMQLFIFSAIVLCLYHKHKLYCVLLLWLTMVASLAFTMYMNITHDFKQAIHLDDFGPKDTSFTDVYTKPWCRCAPYLYGILFAMFVQQAQLYLKHKQNYTRNWVHRCADFVANGSSGKIVLQLLGICVMLFLILIPRTSQVGYRWSTLINSLYLTFAKLLFVFGVSVLILPALLTNNANCILHMILDNKLTNFISKISFMVYLIHLNVIMQFTFNIKVQSYYSIINLFVLFISHTIISCLIATFLVFILEIPAYQLQKYYIHKIKYNQRQINNNIQQL